MKKKISKTEAEVMTPPPFVNYPKDLPKKEKIWVIYYEEEKEKPVIKTLITSDELRKKYTLWEISLDGIVKKIKSNSSPDNL